MNNKGLSQVPEQAYIANSLLLCALWLGVLSRSVGAWWCINQTCPHQGVESREVVKRIMYPGRTSHRYQS
jgi:hypothetical protein